MNTNITTEQVEQYQRDGFVCLDGFLSDKELEKWRAVTDQAVVERLEATRRVNKSVNFDISALTNQGDADAYYAQVFTQCVRLADTSADMAELMLDARLGKVAATLAQVDGIRVWHDQALIKPPYGNPTAWHLDVPYWSFQSRDALSIWVALDDATLANGCLWYLPGTHKTARFENVNIGHNQRDLFKLYPEWETREAVSVPCRAGGAVFHNGLTAHGAGANMTPRPRRAMTCAYMPDGATFNGQQNVLPPAYFATLKIGDPLDNEPQNPLLWSWQGN